MFFPKTAPLLLLFIFANHALADTVQGPLREPPKWSESLVFGHWENADGWSIRADGNRSVVLHAAMPGKKTQPRFGQYYFDRGTWWLRVQDPYGVSFLYGMVPLHSGRLMLVDGVGSNIVLQRPPTIDPKSVPKDPALRYAP